MSKSIPKIIHYCWFGPNKMPRLTMKCIRSWKRYLPDYKLVLWNEENFDINENLYVKQAYNAEKYAFVTDYVRLFALQKYGGIYMDTDVEVKKNLDIFLNHSAFSGCESETHLLTGIIGGVKNHEWIKRLLKYYDDASFINEDGSYNTKTNVSIITEITKKEYGWVNGDEFQVLKDNVTIYPTEYFSPLNWKNRELELTKNSYCIHHFSGSWLNKKPLTQKVQEEMQFKLRKVSKIALGEQTYEKIKKVIKGQKNPI